MYHHHLPCWYLNQLGSGMAPSSPAIPGCHKDTAYVLEGICSSVAGMRFLFYENLIRFSD